MVKKIKTATAIRLLSCLLTITLTASVSAQSYPQRGRVLNSSRATRSANQSDLGESLVNGVANLFKKKDKSKDKKQSTVSATKPLAEDEVELIVSADGQTKEQATLSALRSALEQDTIETKKDDVKLVVISEGDNKDEAVNIALRKAIEQTYGVFVSSNTRILDDNVVKDEIVTIASGNIKSFKCLSENIIDNKCVVSVEVIVSIGNLVKFVKSKGGNTELAGNSFAMNVKMAQLNKENENKAIETLKEQLKSIAQFAFDYEITVGEPIKDSRKSYYVNETQGNFYCPVTIHIKANKNVSVMHDLMNQTLKSLSLTKMEAVNLSKMGIRTFNLTNEYILRDYYDYFFKDIYAELIKHSFDFEIVDDLGIYTLKKQFFTTQREEKDWISNRVYQRRLYFLPYEPWVTEINKSLNKDFPNGTILFYIDNRAEGERYPSSEQVDLYSFSAMERFKLLSPPKYVIYRQSYRKKSIIPTENMNLDISEGSTFVTIKGELNYTLAELEQIKNVSIAPIHREP